MEEAPESYKNVTDVVDTCHAAGISAKAIKLRPIAVIKGWGCWGLEAPHSLSVDLVFRKLPSFRFSQTFRFVCDSRGWWRWLWWFRWFQNSINFCLEILVHSLLILYDYYLKMGLTEGSLRDQVKCDFCILILFMANLRPARRRNKFVSLLVLHLFTFCIFSIIAPVMLDNHPNSVLSFQLFSYYSRFQNDLFCLTQMNESCSIPKYGWARKNTRRSRCSLWEDFFKS